ncbi:MAG: plastocyanin/azurin family copper-binding protein [Gemmatimonadales bacterium]
MPRQTSWILLGGLALAISACSSDPTGPDTTADIQATTNSTFSPSDKTVTAGATVRWGFASLGHRVVFDAVAGRPADILGVNTNTVIARTFTTVGDFGYECTIHPGMRGTVHVVAGN